MLSNPFDLSLVIAEDLDRSQLDKLVNNYHRANRAKDLLIDGLISLSDFEEIIDDCDIDPEDYSEQVEENATLFAG